MTSRRPLQDDARLPPEPLAVVRERAASRVRIVGTLLTFALLASGLRGIQLAVDPDDKTLQIATDKRWASIATQGPRGEVRDRDGHVLAMSVRTPAVFADPVTLRERGVDVDRAAARIAPLLELDPAEVAARLSGKARYVRLARGVHPAVADELRATGLTRKGLIIEENYRRFYPQGRFASHVLGFVDDRGQGVQGLEATFDAELQGEQFVAQLPVNRDGTLLDLPNRDDREVQGMTVHTTLDRAVQRTAERALQGVMERHEPAWATAVAVEVETGRVLAMANAPSFNPNRRDDVAAMRNRAVADAIEPGSVFKPFTMAAAVELGVARPTEVLTTPSPFRIGPISIRDDHPHDRVTVQEMVKFSSNVGSAKLAARVGEEHLVKFFEDFGFGEPTGIVTTHEARGIRHPPGKLGPVELATISYGQGATATALQLAMASAAIGHDGVRLKPMLVERVTDPFGRVRQEFEPTVVRRVISAETAAAVKRAMEMVTEADGTGTRARVPGFRVAGKTGTAMKVVDGVYSPVARYATFIGFAPVEDPKVAIAVIVDDPTRGSRYGGVVAAPVFAQVMATALDRLGLEPDPALMEPPDDELPEEEPVVEHRPVAVPWQGEAWTLPDLSGRALRDVLAGLQGTGLHLQIEGRGLLARQDPSPGTPLAPGDTVHLEFR